MTKENKESTKKFTIIAQNVINIFLIVLTVVLIFLLFSETYLMIKLTFTSDYSNVFYKEFLKSLLTFFLYFEFVAMIIKYFKEDYHFPLRYFMYIGITATTRVIIVDHESGLETLYFALAILSLVVAYGIIRFLSMLKQKWGLDED